MYSRGSGLGQDNVFVKSNLSSKTRGTRLPERVEDLEGIPSGGMNRAKSIQWKEVRDEVLIHGGSPNKHRRKLRVVLGSIITSLLHLEEGGEGPQRATTTCSSIWLVDRRAGASIIGPCRAVGMVRVGTVVLVRVVVFGSLVIVSLVIMGPAGAAVGVASLVVARSGASDGMRSFTRWTRRRGVTCGDVSVNNDHFADAIVVETIPELVVVNVELAPVAFHAGRVRDTAKNAKREPSNGCALRRAVGAIERLPYREKIHGMKTLHDEGEKRYVS
jgi:hypothetical protein